MLHIIGMATHAGETIKNISESCSTQGLRTSSSIDEARTHLLTLQSFTRCDRDSIEAIAQRKASLLALPCSLLPPKYPLELLPSSPYRRARLFTLLPFPFPLSLAFLFPLLPTYNQTITTIAQLSLLLTAPKPLLLLWRVWGRHILW